MNFGNQVDIKAVNKPVLSDKEIRFLDMVLEGMPYNLAFIESGMLEGDKDDVEVRKKASAKANKFLRTKKATEYLRANRKTISVYTPSDIDKLATHMYEIAMGTATRTEKRLNDDLEIEEYDEHPSFKDQISAAQWLRSYTNDLRANTRYKTANVKKSDVIDAKATEFISKWKIREISDGHFERSTGLPDGIGRRLDEEDKRDAGEL